MRGDEVPLSKVKLFQFKIRNTPTVKRLHLKTGFRVMFHVMVVGAARNYLI